MSILYCILLHVVCAVYVTRVSGGDKTVSVVYHIISHVVYYIISQYVQYRGETLVGQCV